MSGSRLTDRAYRRIVNAWCVYDWANSAFATTVMAALFPPFFRSLATAAGMPEGRATAAWAFTTAAALLIAALIAPVLGAIADATGSVKRHLAVFAGLGILATGSFVLIPAGNWILAAALFVAADIGFAASIVFYESLLPHIARPGDIDRISTRGYALGYAGGGLLLALHALWISQPSLFGMPGRDFAVRAAFASVAVWWALFAIPFLRRVPEPGRGTGPVPAEPRREPHDGSVTVGRRMRTLRLELASPAHSITLALRRLWTTLHEMRRYRQLFAFLVAFWIYSDGIGTIIKMAVAYGDELGISLTDLVRALLLTQFIGIPCSLLFGAIAARLGAKRGLLLGLAFYALICAGGYFMRTALHFYMLAAAVGLVQGGCQALSRSLFGSMVPRHKAAEFFGLYSTSSRFAGIAGPVLFGLISQAAGNSRLSILALIAFFAIGGALLTRVNVAEGRRLAREAETHEADLVQARALR
ncbi:MAG: MFS transporter [Candidatus Eisenbacteria bacterium]